MTLKNLISINAFLAIGAGLAFALYGPLMLILYGLAEIPENNPVLYWNVAAFARMFGAALFGFGMLLWALRVSSDAATPDSSAIETKLPLSAQGLLSSLLLANLGLSVTAATQSAAAWSTIAGWITAIIFALFAAGYGVLLARNRTGSEPAAQRPR